jgi:hypothetical protein
MRVKTLTLTTASAAALTIGLASPAFALATAAEGLGSVHNQTGFGAHHQGVLHNGVHQVALPKGNDDDDDDEGDDDDGGDAEIGGRHRTHHTKGLCGVGGRIGGLANGCGEESGDDDDDDDGGGGGGDFGSQHASACCAGGREARRVTVTRQAAPAQRQRMVPSGAVRSGFGGSQGMNAPLGLAGMSLLLGGAGLLPVARRRLRARARS